MTTIFLGMPSPNIEQWIKDHSQSAYHADTWYKYAGDTEWRTVSITGTISSSGSAPTTQIPDVKNVIALEIGSDVTSIGGYAFSGCRGLTSVTIPDSVTSIGNWAFQNCDGLTSVTIPDSVTSISSGVFYYTNNMQTITFENRTKSQVQAIQYYNWGATKYADWMSYYPTITFVCSDGNIVLDKSPGSN